MASPPRTLPRVRRFLPLLLCAVTLSCTSARLAGRDVVAVAKAPVMEWKKVAVATAVVGGVVLLDDEIARVARGNDSQFLDSGAKLIEPLGGGRSDQLMAGLLLYGLAAKNDTAKNAAFDAIVASTIAARAVTPGLKQLIGRERPNGGDDPSFPSGHATQAFAVASAIAENYEQRWVKWVAYGLATGVGVSRVYHDAHWTTDVLAGAAIGAFTGHTVAATNKKLRVTPIRNGLAVSLAW